MTSDLARQSALGERLRVARQQAGLSQGQVAKLLALHRPTISEIEAGRRKVSADELVRFAEIYGVSTAWLMAATADNATPHQAKVELAARELAKLKQEDLDRLLELLTTLKREE